MMERGIKYGDLGNILSQQFSSGQNSSHIVRVVKWRQINAVFDSLQYAVIDQGRFFECLAAMHDAVSHGMHIRSAFDLGDARSIGSNVSEQVVEGRTHVAQWRGLSLARFVAIPGLDDRFAADSVDFPAQNPIILVLLDSLRICRDDLKL